MKPNEAQRLPTLTCLLCHFFVGWCLSADKQQNCGWTSPAAILRTTPNHVDKGFPLLTFSVGLLQG